MPPPSSSLQHQFLPRHAIDAMLALLIRKGFTVIAPVVRHGIVGLATVSDATQLPKGVSDDQSPGHYRTIVTDQTFCFEQVVGADSPKRFFFPPAQRLLEFRLHGERFEVTGGPPPAPRLAFLGIRPCDLAAIRIQDRVFGSDDPSTMRCEAEPWYTAARAKSLLIVVNCTRPGGNCFCASMGTGPQAGDGADLAMTELHGGFVVTVASESGRELLAQLPARDPTEAEIELAELKIARACEHMGRKLSTEGLKSLLERTVEHPHWDQVASRCLSCGNCTMVCPTCFCSTVSDSTDLSGRQITRLRQWESCFTHHFSYTTPGPVRNTVRGRYRHWLRHKLCTWLDQFGTSGCVGCGRCITWCPVGIDLTVEIERLREAAGTNAPPASPPREVTL